MTIELNESEEWPTNELINALDNDEYVYNSVYETVKEDQDFSSYPDLEDLINEHVTHNEDLDVYTISCITFSSREFYNINYNYVLEHIQESLKSW